MRSVPTTVSPDPVGGGGAGVGTGAGGVELFAGDPQAAAARSTNGSARRAPLATR
jgi:hypothetical protein